MTHFNLDCMINRSKLTLFNIVSTVKYCHVLENEFLFFPGEFNTCINIKCLFIYALISHPLFPQAIRFTKIVQYWFNPGTDLYLI